MLARFVTLAKAPCSRPCSFAGTARDINPWTAGWATVQPEIANGMTAYIIHPCVTAP